MSNGASSSTSACPRGGLWSSTLRSRTGANCTPMPGVSNASCPLLPSRRPIASERRRIDLRGRSARERNGAMYNNILVPIDLADAAAGKPALAAAVMMASQSNGRVRLINVLPLTPVMLAEYVPPDFEVQQRKAAEDALAILVKEVGLPGERASATVRQGGIYQEI